MDSLNRAKRCMKLLGYGIKLCGLAKNHALAESVLVATNVRFAPLFTMKTGPQIGSLLQRAGLASILCRKTQ